MEKGVIIIARGVEYMICKNCNRDVDNTKYGYCIYCGRPIKRKYKYDSFLISFFILFGWLGLHRIYLRRKASGTIMFILGISFMDLLLIHHNKTISEFKVLLFLILFFWVFIDFCLIVLGKLKPGDPDYKEIFIENKKKYEKEKWRLWQGRILGICLIFIIIVIILSASL
jgi:hypothetical protein